MQVRATLVLILSTCAVAVTGCAATHAPTPAHVLVPKLEGKKERDALCQLQRLGLRWRFRGSHRAESRPPSSCGDTGSFGSSDDVLVTGQAPSPGERVRRGKIITLDDECTDAAREGQGCA